MKYIRQIFAWCAPHATCHLLFSSFEKITFWRLIESIEVWKQLDIGFYIRPQFNLAWPTLCKIHSCEFKMMMWQKSPFQTWNALEADVANFAKTENNQSPFLEDLRMRAQSFFLEWEVFWLQDSFLFALAAFFSCSVIKFLWSGRWGSNITDRKTNWFGQLPKVFIFHHLLIMTSCKMLWPMINWIALSLNGRLSGHFWLGTQIEFLDYWWRVHNDGCHGQKKNRPFCSICSRLMHFSFCHWAKMMDFTDLFFKYCDYRYLLWKVAWANSLTLRNWDADSTLPLSQLT